MNRRIGRAVLCAGLVALAAGLLATVEAGAQGLPSLPTPRLRVVADGSVPEESGTVD
jgi:hypothetical protein